MVAAHTKEGCCIDGADVMYFMNVNRFKNKTKKSTHNILSLFTAVFLHPDITIPVDWAKKKDQLLTYYCSFSMLLSTFYSFIYTHLLLPFFNVIINILFIHLSPFIIAVFPEGRTAHPGIAGGERQRQQSVSLLPDLWSEACTGDRWQHKAPLLTTLTTQSTFTYSADNTKHLYLQHWWHKAPLLTALTTQSTFTYNTDNTKHLYLQRWQHKAPLLTTLTTQSTFTYTADNTKHLYLQQWQHKAPLLTTQSSFTYSNDNTKHLSLQHKAALLTTMTTKTTFTYNTKHLYLQQEWLYNTKHIYLQ